MCGIFGLIRNTNTRVIDKEKVKSSALLMKHRGPDAFQQWGIPNKIELAHLRLSIIDLSDKSHQPFFSECEKYVIVFNGEIYNYLEIKKELEQLGYKFRTSSDTEVLLSSYIEWGDECVQKFNGDWAFAIYDIKNEILFCSRDRYGVKPFNYAIVDDQFIFASEIKAILGYFPELKVPNYNVIANYCRTSIGAQIKETWFENVFRLEPAHNLIIDSSGISKHRYWDYPREINTSITFDEAKEKYKDLFHKAVKLRMRSDVPVGFTLSSGIDSTSIVSMLKGQLDENKKTYTAAFSGTAFDSAEKQNFKNNVEIDEPKLVKKLANEIDFEPTIVEVNFNDYVKSLSKIIYHLESGHGSPAIYPLDSILSVASEEVTVVLEGQGADELLGGYISNVQSIYFINLIKKLKFKAAFKEISNFKKVYSLKAAVMLFVRNLNINWLQNLYYRVSGINNFYIGKLKTCKQIKDYPIEPLGFDCKLNEHLYKSHTGGLVNLLHYGDCISMKSSLESRLPFMDFRLVEFVFSLPSNFKVSNGVGKFIHREAMKGVVPDFILSNPIKFGFDTPLLHIFSNTADDSASKVLLSKRCLERGLFSKKAIEKAIRDQNENKKNQSRILYRMLNVELWFREFIDELN